MARDRFSQATKTSLARRAGYLCSFPGCNAVTVGPSCESATATANTGEAAHIAAASSGRNSRRYDPTMSPEERAAFDNGLWCCNTHAKLIDTDEATYTVPMLRHWRVLAEKRAEIRQIFGDVDFSLGHSDLKAVGLAPETISLNAHAEINQAIGTAIRCACIAEIAGTRVADTLRDFLVEYVRNSLTHGGASEASIAIENTSIRVIDNGSAFQLSELLQTSTRGGGLAYRALLELARIGAVSTLRSETGENHLYIPFVVSARDLPKANPCAISIDKAQVHRGPIDFTPVQDCDRVFLIAPDYSSYSDGPVFEGALRGVLADHPRVVLVFPDVSERVLKHFKDIFAPAEVVTW